MGRLFRLPFPGPPLLAVATVPFIFDRTWTIYGGNAASTLAGEYSFSISLVAGPRVLRRAGPRARGRPAPRPGQRAARARASSATPSPPSSPSPAARCSSCSASTAAGSSFAAPVLAVGCLLTAFWSVPFVLRRGLPHRHGLGEARGLPGRAAPRRPALGAGPRPRGPRARRLRSGSAPARSSVRWPSSFGLGFWLDAASPVHIWNARLLPFYYLCLYLLAAVGVSEVRAVDRGDRRRPGRVAPARGGAHGRGPGWARGDHPRRAPAAASLPGGHDRQADGKYHWLFLETTRQQLRATAGPSGTTRATSARPTTRSTAAIMATMQDVGETDGCGRAHWEYDETPQPLRHADGDDAPAVLDRRVHRFDGGPLLRELGHHAVPLPDRRRDVREAVEPGARPARATDAVQRLRPRPRRRAHAAVRAPGTTWPSPSRPWPPRTGTPTSREIAASPPWHVYEVADSALVEPLANEPAVLEGMEDANPAWQRDAVAWYNDPAALDVVLAPRGPSSWQRIERGEEPERRPAAAHPCDEHRRGRPVDQLRRRSHRRADPREDVLLPELEGEGRRGPLSGHTEPDGRDPDRGARGAHVRQHVGGVPRLGHVPRRGGRCGTPGQARRGSCSRRRRAGLGPTARAATRATTAGSRLRGRRRRTAWTSSLRPSRIPSRSASGTHSSRSARRSWRRPTSVRRIAPGDGRPSGAPLLDADGDLGDDEPGPLRP